MKVLLLALLGIAGMFAFGFGFKIVKENNKFKWYLLLLLIYGMFATPIGFVCAGAAIIEENPDKIHSMDFDLKTEIHTEYIDSTEVSRDTIYIFTPKKK